MEKKLTQQPHGLLIVDLQAGFNPSPDLVASINLKLAQQYSMVVATAFINPSQSLFRSRLGYEGMSSGTPETQLLLTSDAHIVLEKVTYGLTAENIELIKSTNRAKCSIEASRRRVWVEVKGAAGFAC